MVDHLCSDSAAFMVHVGRLHPEQALFSAAPIEDEPGQYLTLSQYKDKFSASSAPPLT